MNEVQHTVEQGNFFSSYFVDSEIANQELDNIFAMLEGKGDIDAFEYAWNKAEKGEKEIALDYLKMKRADVFKSTVEYSLDAPASAFSSHERNLIARFMGKFSHFSALTAGRIHLINNAKEKLVRERQEEMAGVAL